MLWTALQAVGSFYQRLSLHDTQSKSKVVTPSTGAYTLHVPFQTFHG